MGIDERVTYAITVENGQVNIASDHSTINATNTINSIDAETLNELIGDINKNAKDLSIDDKETLVSSLDVIKEESKSSNPRRSFLKTAIVGLQTIKGTVEFAAAVTALIQFIQSML